MCNIFRGCYYFDGTQIYTYNDNTDIAGKKDFEGNMTAVSYVTRTRTKKTSYADGTENIIVYDEWEKSDEAGWLEKQSFQDAKQSYDNSKK